MRLLRQDLARRLARLGNARLMAHSFILLLPDRALSPLPNRVMGITTPPLRSTELSPLPGRARQLRLRLCQTRRLVMPILLLARPARPDCPLVLWPPDPAPLTGRWFTLPVEERARL